jgi:hypothetical protein
MQRLFSSWLRTLNRLVRPRFYADPRASRGSGTKLPRIEDVLARTGREPPIAD